MTFNEKIEQLDKELRELRSELEGDLEKYNTQCPDENRLINDPEYCRQWIRGEIESSSRWFSKEIYK
ncbi:hypothetical protein [Robertmurraya sp.]|uniref:hypothetical protein n=1 Tax=Robertmurraya sp. TaxID=2837525 RepID=UPI00370452EF